MSSTDKTGVAEFVRLTEPCHRQLYGVALSLCRDADQAADLAQETLVHAFEAFHRFQPGAPVFPWLRRILRNVFLDTFKTGRARHEVAESEMSGSELSHGMLEMREGPDPLARLEHAQLAAWMQEEIASLSPAHQQVLLLCVMQDLSFQEAADISGMPVGTVASRLARARAELRERMLRRAAVVRRQEGEDGESLLPDANSRLGRSNSEGPRLPLRGGQEEEPDRSEEVDRAEESS